MGRYNNMWGKQPHVVATWGDYVRALDTKDNEVIVIPAGHYNITEENLKKNKRVELLIASRQVEGTYGPGQGLLHLWNRRGTDFGKICTDGKIKVFLGKGSAYNKGRWGKDTDLNILSSQVTFNSSNIFFMLVTGFPVLSAIICFAGGNSR